MQVLPSKLARLLGGSGRDQVTGHHQPDCGAFPAVRLVGLPARPRSFASQQARAGIRGEGKLTDLARDNCPSVGVWEVRGVGVTGGRGRPGRRESASSCGMGGRVMWRAGAPRRTTPASVASSWSPRLVGGEVAVDGPCGITLRPDSSWSLPLSACTATLSGSKED